MADITEIKLPDATVFTVKDPNAQPKTLATPLTINGNTETTVEDALDGLNDYGDALADNLAADENVYSAKNLNSYPYYDTTKSSSGVTFTDNGNGTITATGTAGASMLFAFHLRNDDKAKLLLNKGIYKLNGCPSGGSLSTYYLRAGITKDGNFHEVGVDTGNGCEFTIENDNTQINLTIETISGTVYGVDGLTFYPMLRDARVLDDTFVPFAETNLQLTNDKAERDDLSTIHATGSTNTTGSTIANGTFFYLNGQFCKALTNIADGATFTLNTNYKITTASEEVETLNQKTNFLKQKYFALDANTFSVDIPLTNSCIALVAAMYPTGANAIKSEIYIVSRQGSMILMDKIGGNGTGTTIVVKDYYESTITIPANNYGATIGFLQLEG